MVDPLSSFLFQLVLHNWCNKRPMLMLNGSLLGFCGLFWFVCVFLWGGGGVGWWGGGGNKKSSSSGVMFKNKEM